MKTQPANPLWKRLQRRYRAWRYPAQPKTHQVDWVWVEGQRQKRIRFASQAEADRVTAVLRTASTIGCFSPWIKQDQRDVFVAYIESAPSSDLTPNLIGDFFNRLYEPQVTAEPSKQPATLALVELVRNLEVSVQNQTLSPYLAEQVDQKAHEIAPPMLIEGIDYVDAIAKNFVIHDDRAIGIDVEAVFPNQWLGLGLAKAEYRGLIDPASVHLPDLIRDQYPFVRLFFAAEYFRQKREQGKPGHINQAILERWVKGS